MPEPDRIKEVNDEVNVEFQCDIEKVAVCCAYLGGKLGLGIAGSTWLLDEMISLLMADWSPADRNKALVEANSSLELASQVTLPEDPDDWEGIKRFEDFLRTIPEPPQSDDGDN